MTQKKITELMHAKDMPDSFFCVYSAALLNKKYWLALGFLEEVRVRGD